MVRLFFTLLLIAHILACMFLGLAVYQKYINIENNWLTKYDSNENNFYAMYCYSLYLTVMTMTSVGYGDITPANLIEVIFLTW